MAPIRLLIASLLATALLAGCASNEKPALSDVFGADAATSLPDGSPAEYNGTPFLLIGGMHLQARINEGDWGTTIGGETTVPAIAGPTMAGAAPMGGGGETTALSGANASRLDVRIKEFDQLAGYTVMWGVAVGGNTTVTMRPANEMLETQMPVAGPIVVVAALYASADDKVPAAVFAPLKGTVKVHWTITGEVQPQKVSAAGVSPPGGASRDSMVDKYTVDLPAGVTVTATTKFDGTYSPSDGTDVDIGLYDPNAAPLLCSAGALGSSSPVDPVQATETFTSPTDSSGLWSVQVGAMQDGCEANGAAGSFQYTNAGPVPYQLDIVLS
ncbi:MAG: hypothetical protein V4510_07740 [bacterium]